jgi:hypothetical protein
MVLWLSFVCSPQPVKNESRHVLWLLAVQEMPRARNEVKTMFTGEVLHLVHHELGAKVIATAECERRNVNGSGD